MTPAGRTYSWGHQRRFNSYPEYFKKKFGGRVQKLSLDAGFTCPNRDGSKGKGGCTFCNNNAFNPAYCQPEKSISVQIDEGIEFHKKRYRRTDKYLAYFQAYSNTYAEIEVLRERYEEALGRDEVIGLVLGTRPDTVDAEILDYIKSLTKDHYVVIEYGIESCYNSTLERVNRGHSFEDSLRAIEMTASRGIRQGAHFIIGLPGESVGEILAGIRTISRLPINNIKFHQLQIVRNTMMARQYRMDPEAFRIFELEEYLELMLMILELLNPEFVVERIAGESNPGYLLSPSWGLRYDQVLNKFEQMLASEDTWQGKRFSP
ncbi:MAG: radical SAM protein [Bacteroides sp. SM23_62]|nr:MAG: radical SAM protein [Bacteroides sp. SM23_62]